MPQSERNIAGVVLAAGEGKRAGGNKALFKIGDVTFLETIVTSLRASGCAPVIVVVGAEADAVRESAGKMQVEFVINESWQQGQFSSLKTGLKKVDPGYLGAMVTLVDHPLVKKETYMLLAETFWDFPDMIILPMHGIQHGHPVVIPHKIMNEIEKAPVDTNLKELMSRHSDLIYEQLVDDPGILQDIDTEADLRRIQQEWA
jgi:CTP:molybdopterin cytidylyltransferase MocA